MALAPTQNQTSNPNDNPNAFGPNRPAGTSQGEPTSSPNNSTSMSGSTTAPVIPVDVAVGGVKPLDLPNKPTSTASADLIATAGGSIVPPPAPQAPKTPQGATNTPVVGGDYKSQYLAQIDQISARPGELTEQFGIQKKLEDYNAAKTKYDLLKEGYRVQKEKELMNGALSADQKQARIAELDRKEAFTAGTLAIEYAAKQQDYVGAKELMNQQLQLELEPIKMRADFYRDMFMKTEDQKFQRQMKAEERAYEEKKAAGEIANTIGINAIQAGMNPKQAADFAKNATTKEAASRAGVINAVNEYIKKLDKYKGAAGSGGIFDFNRLTAAEKSELISALNTTVGSAINVAQGQGAMGDQEAKRILGGLNPSRWKRTAVIDSAAKGVIEAQKSLMDTNLDLLELTFPGAKQMPIFSQFMTDEEFFNGAIDTSNVPVTTYFGVDI